MARCSSYAALPEFSAPFGKPFTSTSGQTRLRGVGEFFGTHDSNVKYLESLLKVQVHLQDDTLTVDGPDDKVVLVERLVSDYLQLRSEGVRFSNGDLKSIIRMGWTARESARGVSRRRCRGSLLRRQTRAVSPAEVSR